MNEQSQARVHWSFWLIGAFSLIWNAMGGMNFIMQMSPEMLASMPEQHRALAESRPQWATAAFAVAVFGGAVGCVLLLLRKKLAHPFFVASTVGAIVAVAHAFATTGTKFGLSPFEMVLTVVMPVALAAFLVWYARWCTSKVWIN